MINKPFSQACENNKQAILDILTTVFADTKHVLEIGSGTGQHAVFFGEQLPDIIWQTSDLLVNHEGISSWLNEMKLLNVKAPVIIDLKKTWPDINNNTPVDGVFTANTLHIINWSLVINFFEGISKNIKAGSNVCIYGPFNYKGSYTSESNANFDLWLKNRDVNSGIRDIEAILDLAKNAGLNLEDDHAMPANNRLLVFTKI